MIIIIVIDSGEKDIVHISYNHVYYEEGQDNRHRKTRGNAASGIVVCLQS